MKPRSNAHPEAVGQALLDEAFARPVLAVREAMEIKLKEALARAAPWTAQIWLTMFFLGAGYAKLAVPMEHLDLLLTWPQFVPDWFVRAAGAVEIALSILTSFNLVVTRRARLPALAAGLILAMTTLVMGGVHLVGGEWRLASVNLVLFALALIVVRAHRLRRGAAGAGGFRTN